MKIVKVLSFIVVSFSINAYASSYSGEVACSTLGEKQFPCELELEENAGILSYNVSNVSATNVKGFKSSVSVRLQRQYKSCWFYNSCSFYRLYSSGYESQEIGYGYKIDSGGYSPLSFYNWSDEVGQHTIRVQWAWDASPEIDVVVKKHDGTIFTVITGPSG